MNRLLPRFSCAILAVSILFLAGCSTQPATKSEVSPGTVSPEVVKAGQFDTGKMWTFDFPPLDYFAKTYSFNPTKEWFDKARLAALRLPGCTAAFVSEDGLVMTNHHCARGSLQRVQKEGEKLVEVGFYATKLEDERKASVYIDQLVLIEDVTKEIQTAYDTGTTDSAKSANRSAKMNEIQQRSAEKFKQTTKDSMVFSIYAFYNGGRYSLYGFKRYTDVRLVYAPEEKAAFFGGDPDNFTYPRYDFDCSFFRVYENDKPIKTANFFKFSQKGAQEGDAVFVIGNPGSTNRLLTFAQLETLRDYQYPAAVDVGTSRLKVLNDYVAKHPEKNLEYMNQIFGVANSLKSQTGTLGGLRDATLMAKKKDFENTFRSSVLNNPTLKAKYGDPWKEIADYEAQRRALIGESNGLNASGARSQYMSIAARLVARVTTPADARGPRGGGQGPGGRPPGEGRPGGGGPGALFPSSFVPENEIPLLADQLRFMKNQLGTRNEAFNTLLGNRTPEQAAEEIAKTAVTGSKEKVEALAAGKPEEILKSTDPLISFVVKTQARSQELQAKMAEIRAKQVAPSQTLGRAMYEVFGTSIPPDATFSLRIADGFVKGYEYNGTIAPPVTTFYGLYDRYYSFGKKDPWLITDRWANPPADFDMSTPMNFAATNDIIGGNSGSSVINKNLEVVGLIFDGNIESLPGNFIYEPTRNRSVSVHSAGIIEGLDKIYRAERIAKELKAGKIVP
jgi:hypothetical protein